MKMDTKNTKKKIDTNTEEKYDDGGVTTLLRNILLGLILALVLKNFVLSSTYVVGNSMYPTLEDADRLLSTKIPLYLREPKPGDIVIISAPDMEDKDYIKRVIGIEGDIIEISYGKVYVNGDMLVEDYIERNSYTQTYQKNVWRVGRNEIFVMGDNREEMASKDSRYFGCVNISTVKGIATFRYYPFTNKFGSIN